MTTNDGGSICSTRTITCTHTLSNDPPNGSDFDQCLVQNRLDSAELICSKIGLSSGLPGTFSMFSGCGVSVRLEQKLIVIVLLGVVAACAILPSARATVHIAVAVNPSSPSPYTGFTIVGDFVGYGSGVNWVMYFDVADSSCVPQHSATAPFTGTTDSLGEFYAHISGQPAGTYVVQVRDDFGDNSGRVCFTIG